MKILICGSRGWKDPTPVTTVIAGYEVLAEGAGEVLEIVHGDAKSGADALADRIGKQWGCKVIPEPAEWDRYGKSAGPIRNQRMLDSHPDISAVWAFRAHGKSSGTDDMVSKAERANIPYFVITGGDNADPQ